MLTRRIFSHGLRGPLSPRRRRPGLRVEALEGRLLLAAITVNTTADEDDHSDPTLSLREAIEVSNGTLAVSMLSPQAAGTGQRAARQPEYDQLRHPRGVTDKWGVRDRHAVGPAGDHLACRDRRLQPALGEPQHARPGG